MTHSQLRARYWRLVAFFAGVTARFIVWELLLPRLGMARWSRRTRSERYRRTAVRFRALALRRGGLMIKVGQFLSARLDVLPREVTDELAGLQDEVPPEDFALLRALAEVELGGRLEDHFAWVDPTPMAAASLGQVHRARLHPADAQVAGFTEVVVKIQRPHIEAVVEVDLAALRRAGGWLSRYRPVSRRADVPALVEEFAQTAREEIDYLAEADNAETFGTAFQDDPRIRIPAVVRDLTTRRVLTLENVAAIKISDRERLTAAGIDGAEVASVLVDAYLTQILDDGFFHADPHPGNLFVVPTESWDDGVGSAWHLTFVDFGMVGRTPENLRSGLRELLVAVGTQDAVRLVRSYATLGVLLPGADRKLLERAGEQIFERFWGLSMAELKDLDHAELARLAPQFRELLLDLPFQLPQNLLILGRTVALLSGMCTGLDPEFNLWAALTPYAARLLAEDGEGPGQDGAARQTPFAEGTALLRTAIGLPGRVDRVLRTIERDELTVQLPRLELRVRRLERSVNRLNGGLMFAALLVSGAVLSGTDPGLGKVLMGAALVPAIWSMLPGRRHSG